MNNKDRINYLTSQHTRLDTSTTELESKLTLRPNDTVLAQNLVELKRKKLSVKDELTELERSEANAQETFDFQEHY
tara:strand:+ start:1787 stop:2014 length:228 start_codon:yes stop_codon:yes gene_type:complete